MCHSIETGDAVFLVQRFHAFHGSEFVWHFSSWLIPFVASAPKVDAFS